MCCGICFLLLGHLWREVTVIFISYAENSRDVSAFNYKQKYAMKTPLLSTVF